MRSIPTSVPLLVCLLMAGFQLSQADSATCDKVRSDGRITELTTPELEYTEISNDYWSTGCSALKPTCILTPTSAEEVSEILTLLVANNESFAIKSGGHNPNKYFNSIDGGPLISTSSLNEVTYDSVTNTVRVGSGNKWDDVQKVLDPLGVTVVGGRIGNVGVGGYIVGAGLSFLSTQYGWAANNLAAAEMVLPNGTIVTASNTSNEDLFAAIKGGGNNMGIVTTYIVQAHPIGQIWGGNLIWLSADKSNGILSAVRNFTENYDDPKAAIIVTAELILANSTNLWIIFAFYDGPNPPAGIFDEFLALDPDINDCTTRSYGDFLTANNVFVLHGSVYLIGTETTPLPPVDRPDIMQAYYNYWHEVSASISDVFGVVASIAFQPLPKSLTAIAREKGGDLLDLDDDVDRIILEFDYSYVFESLDAATVDGAMVELYSGLKDRVDSYVGDGSLKGAYLPLFMNDCYHEQDYWGRLRPEKRQFAEGVREAVDPAGIMQTLSHGFHM